MWSMINDRLLDEFRSHDAVRDLIGEVESKVRDGEVAATVAADGLVDRFLALPELLHPE